MWWWISHGGATHTRPARFPATNAPEKMVTAISPHVPWTAARNLRRGCRAAGERAARRAVSAAITRGEERRSIEVHASRPYVTNANDKCVANRYLAQ
jgi:hypothetical protein